MTKQLPVAEQFIRKPYPVDVMLVTEDNIEIAAKWCCGRVEDNKYLTYSNPCDFACETTVAIGQYLVLPPGNGFWECWTAEDFEEEFEADTKVNDIKPFISMGYLYGDKKKGDVIRQFIDLGSQDMTDTRTYTAGEDLQMGRHVVLSTEDGKIYIDRREN